MHLKPIHNDADYALALQETDRLWDAADGTPQADTLEILVTLVEAYEKGRYELPPPGPDRSARNLSGEPRLDAQRVGTLYRQPRARLGDHGGANAR